MLNFDFLEKGLGLVSSPHFGYNFSEKSFSCYILLTDKFSMSDCLYFLRYRAIYVLQLFVSQVVINFEINHIFLIKPFFLYDKKVKIKI